MGYKNKQDLYDYQKQRWINRKIKAVEYKGGCCQACGYSKCLGALEFHHRDKDTKEFSWIKLRLRNWESVLLELDKCDLLCANCHRETHYFIH